jgi:hypothetical protein
MYEYISLFAAKLAYIMMIWTKFWETIALQGHFSREKLSNVFFNKKFVFSWCDFIPEIVFIWYANFRAFNLALVMICSQEKLKWKKSNFFRKKLASAPIYQFNKPRICLLLVISPSELLSVLFISSSAAGGCSCQPRQTDVAMWPVRASVAAVLQGRRG